MARWETIDIDDTTEGTSIKALVLDTYGAFEMFGARYELRLCIGITKDELEHRFRHGAELLIPKLKEAGVYPYTDLGRASVFATP